MSFLLQVYVGFVIFSAVVFLVATRIVHRNSIVAVVGYTIIAGTVIGSLLTFAYTTGNWANRFLLAEATSVSRQVNTDLSRLHEAVDRTRKTGDAVREVADRPVADGR